MMIPTSASPESTTSDSLQQLAERVVVSEWSQFQRVNNEGGPASCQSNWKVFHQMRYSQFLAWPMDLLSSYAHDLAIAEQNGRNLLTEKYGRMMQSTAPEEFHRSIEAYIPKLSAERITREERIIVIQLGWAQDFMQRYRALGSSMRTLRTKDDTPEQTSFETYLRGELGTYSDATLSLYENMMHGLLERGCNLTESIVCNTMRIAGYASLQEAERALEQKARN
ncbi:DUF4125 family protein [Bifidobacterium sp.]|jgi:hypothetical protein|uniref:DUF4125 family protein n=1 Tax=Bifidobacterium sp. TaxID=41200 RepID=UPI0025BEE888|nr:DUF4125 family protein [Bifidobacterium sp.]MCI1635352.1 DUF4125 family protein [Bifidobacterium sp.]